MSRSHYFCDGYLWEKEGEIRQSAWAVLFNPTSRESDFAFTFYYEDCAPTTMTVKVPAKGGAQIHLISCPEVIQNKRFGAKIISSEPGIAQITTGYYGLEDKHDWYTRAMHSVICSTRLSRTNYYADGLVLDNPGVRLKEPEWAFLLNPHPEAVDVKLHAHYTSGKRVVYPFHIEAEQLLPVCMDELVIKNKVFGAKYVSSLPIAVQQTRWIEEEDRVTIRSCYSVMARTDLRG